MRRDERAEQPADREAQHPTRARRSRPGASTSAAAATESTPAKMPSRASHRSSPSNALVAASEPSIASASRDVRRDPRPDQADGPAEHAE